jgi:hypothetical protein
MNSKIKSVVRSVHSGIGDLFPSMKTDAIRRINRHPGLSNALRSAAGIEPIENPPEDEAPIGFVKAVRQDAERLTKGVVVREARKLVNQPWVRNSVLPVLDHTPRFRAWLKRSVFEPPKFDGQETCVGAVRDLSRQGLIVYGVLSSLEQRGDD